jgi:uncharacterized membrane protein required for colicin V production
LGSVVLGYIAAVKFHEPVAHIFSRHDSAIAKTVSFIAIFFIFKSIDTIIGWIKRGLFKQSRLSWINRVSGALLGMLKGLIIVMFIIVILLTILPADSGLLTESSTLPYIAALPKISSSVIPKGIRKKYNDKIDKLEFFWEKWEKKKV